MSRFIYWASHSAPGNRWVRAVIKQMLQPQGVVLSQWKKVSGGGREAVLVQYDQEYVMRKFERDFLEPLEMSMSEFGSYYYSWVVKKPRSEYLQIDGGDDNASF